MATYQIGGLENWKRRAGIWGAIGVVAALAAKTSIFPWVILAVILGAVAGFVSLQLVDKNRAVLANIPGYAGIAIFVAAALTLDGNLSALAYLSLGSLFVTAEVLVFGLLGERLVKRLNHRDRDKLATIEKMLQPAPPPEPPSADLQATFLAALPDSLRPLGEAACQPVIIAKPFRSLDSLPPDSSCLSGAPLLDPSDSWPARAGKPLDFLARINLAELPPTSMPRPESGLLSFFYDTDEQPWGGEAEDRDGFVILYHPDPAKLQSVNPPGTGAHPPLRKPVRFEVTPAFSPSREFEDAIHDLADSEDVTNAEEIDELYETLLESGPSDSHRVLSPPVPIQDDMTCELETATRVHGLPADTEWQLLLQLDSDPDLGWCWGDAGMLYFWIPRDDLAAARFDRCWLVLQCT
ncbi:DUF1963 domain-containing protein [Haloferula helveola]|uniref:DUF1963 domain-containing protein n=1 Tax=Haloferula helveola TaxID=490095 RepID=A0ABM7RDJ5_9BACT|nr:DUF1963 domain-containing protein [Haloferula helveola]